MSERKMNILVLEKGEYKEYLRSRGYEDKALNWVDENWDELCNYAESDELTHIVYPSRIKSYLSHHISKELGKNENHCFMEQIMWFSVNDMYQLKDAAPDGGDLFNVITNPIPKADVEDYLLDEEIWEYHLGTLYEQGDWGFTYFEGSVQLIDEDDYFTISYKVY